MSAVATKKSCPVSRGDFAVKAQPIVVKIGDDTLTGEVKNFSSGSFGWYVNGKATIVIDGVPVRCQVGANVTVIGSKETV